MNDLIQELKSKGRFIDAYVVAKNNLSRNMSDVTCFQDFIDLALEIAMYDIVFDERKQYANDANNALALFSESVVIDENILCIIKATKQRINEVVQKIIKDEEEYLSATHRKIEDENTDYLKQLSDAYETLRACKTQEEFETCLSNIADVESCLHIDFFSATQKKTYETLTKTYSKAISQKMEDLNKAQLLEYNKKAIECFNEVFQAFKKEPSRYKTENSLKLLMTSKFFAYDSSKLFNESLVFYNHVYSFIFQESSDALKYKLTEWALNTKKMDN